MNADQKSRLSRLIAILTQLQSKRLLTAREMAEKYGVSIRTIYRDIRALEDSGIPIITEEGRGYSLMEGFNLPPVMFTEKEANSLITAEQLVLRNKDKSFIEHYHNAITKIKSILRYAQKDKVELLSRRIHVFYRDNEEKTSDYLMPIQSAITNFQLIEIHYHSLKDEHTVREIEPFALYNTQGNWLLISYCRLRNDFRSFRLDRIERLYPKDEYFESHDMTLIEYFLKNE